MTVTSWIALAVVAVTVWALIKRYETRLVLITAGLFLACISFTPMQALNAFAKSMTNSGLIMAICSAMPQMVKKWISQLMLKFRTKTSSTECQADVHV